MLLRPGGVVGCYPEHCRALPRRTGCWAAPRWHLHSREPSSERAAAVRSEQRSCSCQLRGKQSAPHGCECLQATFLPEERGWAPAGCADLGAGRSKALMLRAHAWEKNSNCIVFVPHHAHAPAAASPACALMRRSSVEACRGKNMPSLCTRHSAPLILCARLPRWQRHPSH